MILQYLHIRNLLSNLLEDNSPLTSMAKYLLTKVGNLANSKLTYRVNKGQNIYTYIFVTT